MSRESDFWTRRKAKVQEEALADLRAADEIEAHERERQFAEKSDAELLAELGLPDPDNLQPGDDFRAFMAKAVPDRLRRRALRRLWLSNPALANLDGLLDYGEDFTDGATVIENLQTAYQVGKGMTRHVEEMIRQAADEEAPDATEPVDVEEVASETAEPDVEPAEAVPQSFVVETEVPAADEAPAPRRRMRFRFDDHAGGTV